LKNFLYFDIVILSNQMSKKGIDERRNMTTVYFIRHAESDFNVLDDRNRPLTIKGTVDSVLITDFLDMVFLNPWVVKMCFDEHEIIVIEKINILSN